MATIQDQKKLTKDDKGWGLLKVKREQPYKAIQDAVKAITPSKELKDKVKKKVKEIAKPFVDESVAIKHLTKVREKIKDKKKRGPRDE